MSMLSDKCGIDHHMSARWETVCLGTALNDIFRAWCCAHEILCSTNLGSGKPSEEFWSTAPHPSTHTNTLRAFYPPNPPLTAAAVWVS